MNPQDFGNLNPRNSPSKAKINGKTNLATHEVQATTATGKGGSPTEKQKNYPK